MLITWKQLVEKSHPRQEPAVLPLDKAELNKITNEVSILKSKTNSFGPCGAQYDRTSRRSRPPRR